MNTPSAYDFHRPPLYSSNDHGPSVTTAKAPFLSPAGLTFGYLGWVVVWVALLLGLAGAKFLRRDL